MRGVMPFRSRVRDLGPRPDQPGGGISGLPTGLSRYAYRRGLSITLCRWPSRPRARPRGAAPGPGTTPNAFRKRGSGGRIPRGGFRTPRAVLYPPAGRARNTKRFVRSRFMAPSHFVNFSQTGLWPFLKNQGLTERDGKLVNLIKSITYSECGLPKSQEWPKSSTKSMCEISQPRSLYSRYIDGTVPHASASTLGEQGTAQGYTHPLSEIQFERRTLCIDEIP
jgi:hypothetical protein